MGLVTPDFGLVFWMLLSFGIVLFVLKKFAWKPILQMLKQREDSIESALNQAKLAREEMAALKSENEKILAEARNERDKMLKDAKDIKDRIVREAEIAAREKADKIIQASQIEIENQKQKAIAELSAKVAELSVQVAEKILESELSSESKSTSYVNGLVSDLKFN